MALDDSIKILGARTESRDSILTKEALDFVTFLHETYGERRKELLELRKITQSKYDQGAKPEFLSHTAHIRDSKWTVADIPKDLEDRRVEITGPVDRKMIINALNSGANVFMADFEDSNAPTWENIIEGQINLYDAVRKTISLETSKKKYSLNDEIATLMVRPRGWHLPEKHVEIKDEAISGSLFDFGLYFFHNAKELLDNGSGPYFYLPKLESHLEARLWNDVFVSSQDELGIPQGSIRATVLIETLPAAFEMNEMLYELKDHSAGLNCGRWDYLFSYIKTLKEHSDSVLPNRGSVGMTAPFMKAYSDLLIETCHKRGIHAMGGMAAQIPIKNDEEANWHALEKVRADKYREVKAGHDGTWVAHPGLIPIARDIFNENMPTKNQINNQRERVYVTRKDLLLPPSEGEITEGGLRTNISVGVQYLEAWLNGNGCVPLYNLMEDAATAEISRSQVWQWIRHSERLDDGRYVSEELVKEMMDQEVDLLKKRQGEKMFDDASDLFYSMVTKNEFSDFLTLPAYDKILEFNKI